jgi:hypothetical protein
MNTNRSLLVVDKSKQVGGTVYYPNGYMGKLSIDIIEGFELFSIEILDARELVIIKHTCWALETAQRLMDRYKQQFRQY